MDAFVGQKTSRNSRWSRDPVRDGGAAVVARVTERDIEIFKLLARYRYLAVDDIQALVGGELKPLVHRLNLLADSGPSRTVIPTDRGQRSGDCGQFPMSV